MAVDSVQTQGGTDAYGNSYTTNISNDKLTNQDFLTLMLAEMKMQDPTKPMDSAGMLDSQMQMSTIETNLQLAESMASLQSSFAQSTLSNAANVIGKNIEDGNVSDTGYNKAYKVRSVESKDGETFVTAQEILFLEDNMTDKDGNRVFYDINGAILDADGAETGFFVTLTNPGQIAKDTAGKPIILNSDLEIVEQDDDFNFALEGSITPVYSDQLVTIPFSAITKIF